MRVSFLCWLIIVVCSVGCHGLKTDYGRSSGISGRQSINGFAAFRKSIEQASDRIETRDVTRLSRRARASDAIVWIPTYWPPPNVNDVTMWMNEWLAEGNRTLVMINLDDGSEADYWQTATEEALPDQALEYRRRVARQINARLLADDQRTAVQVSDWFVASPLPIRTTTQTDDSVAFTINDASNNKKANKSTTKDVRLQPLREASIDSGMDTVKVTLVAKITKDAWDDSHVIAVSGGGLLTNFAMTKDSSRRMASQIANAMIAGNRGGDAIDDQPKIKVGFLKTDENFVGISKAKPGAPVATGMEVLTTWPLSLVTIHALFLGLVMCLMLLPIFGRPRTVRYNRTTQFGNHLDAMAKLMLRNRSSQSANDDPYVRERISRYFHVVRGETIDGGRALNDVPVDPSPDTSRIELSSLKETS
ncbi:MAG: hypothetical protein AAF745_06095 [Planctomycetota bacterium]